jgi:hypothetical protein
MAQENTKMSYKAFQALKGHAELEMIKSMSPEEINEVMNKMNSELNQLKQAVISNLYDYPGDPKPQGIQRLLDMAEKK